MGEIDQISKALGNIENAVSHLLSGHKETKDTLDTINAKISQQNVDRVVDRLKLDEVHVRLEKLEPIVDSHADKFNFITWLVTGIATLVAFIANVVPQFVKGIFN